jgi:hypothetical protein
MPTDDEFYDLWKSDVINHLQLIYKKGYDDAKQELKREPLSDEVVRKFADAEYMVCNNAFTQGVRWAEQQHKIGENCEQS